MRNISFILFFFGSFLGIAQENEEKLYWSETTLTWKDFKGKPDPTNPYQANTYSGFSFSWSLQNDADGRKFVYEIKSYFLPNQSWVKDGKETDYLLNHEQLHFDISDYYARKFNQELIDFDDSGSLKQVQQRLQKIYQKIENDRQTMQQKYDKETDHSKNKEAQQKWNEKVKDLLSQLPKLKN
ncbi:DUF922 domain-containing protein [Mesonia maritima]|uniref:Txe/YoeB family toxin of Txe-Axe toxin-antitoxin module n=1 Tax=Mesonia maritima TaxID=1793873 RepID=A0ABU1K773_9FLAO|nr:DUF922 domain-containing protein [Mesonia maritima]MDR6301459.1 Txe/YoeB family toxin of Txe-Axe toxin-antitoxin module [Mesonia maritima]